MLDEGDDRRYGPRDEHEEYAELSLTANLDRCCTDDRAGKAVDTDEQQSGPR